MGTWGSNPLENDDALDWMAERGTAADAAKLLKRVARGKKYIEVDEGAWVITAATLVADSLATTPRDAEGERRVDEGPGPKPSPATAQDAVRSLQRVLDLKCSELADLWQHDAEWAVGVKALLHRLGSADASRPEGTDG
jgi:hypothetical protein